MEKKKMHSEEVQKALDTLRSNPAQILAMITLLDQLYEEALIEEVRTSNPKTVEVEKQESKTAKRYEKTLEELIKEHLLIIGVPHHFLGYKYIISAVSLCVENPDLLHGYMTKVIYRDVAKKHNSTSSRVDRSILHAIEVVWETNGDKDILYSYFGNTCSRNKKRPTNSQFIACLADKVIKEIG